MVHARNVQNKQSVQMEQKKNSGKKYYHVMNVQKLQNKCAKIAKKVQN